MALGTEGTHPRRAPCGGWPRGQRPRSEAGPRVSGGFARAAAPSTTSCLARCQGPQEGARRPRAPLAPQCCSEALRGGPQSDLPGEKGLGLRADPTPAVHTGRGWCPGLRGLGRDGVVARSPPIEKTPLQADVRSPPPHRQLPLGRVKPQQLAGEVRGHLVQGSGAARRLQDPLPQGRKGPGWWPSAHPDTRGTQGRLVLAPGRASAWPISPARRLSGPQAQGQSQELVPMGTEGGCGESRVLARRLSVELGRAPDQGRAACWRARTLSHWVAWRSPQGGGGSGLWGGLP